MRTLIVVFVLAFGVACGASQTTTTEPEGGGDAPAAGTDEAAPPPEDRSVDGPACSCEEPIDPACTDMCAAHDALDGVTPEEGE